MSLLAELEPKSVWTHFDEILEIPRGSKNEARIREYIIEVARRSRLNHKTDATGNVVVRKPGTAGLERAPATVLQGHMDMVNEKNSDVEHDFDRDPILPQRDGEYIKATGTTLGSDNGIGLAAMLALMEAKELDHGPLEFLFTVDEETGMTGATALAPELLEGRLLINLDSEEEGVLTIGCAGGGNTRVSVALNHAPAPPGSAALEVKMSGLKGGHSGVDIHLQRGNAIKLLARALHAVSLDRQILIASLQGGSKHNAIPREASSRVVVPGGKGKLEGVSEALEKELRDAQAEYRPAEPDMTFTIEKSEVPSNVLDSATTTKVLNLITGLPHGVIAMSYDIPGLVETSTNLAVVGEEGGELRILMSSRSSVASALAAVRRRIQATASLAGAEVEQEACYPGWKPDVTSRLLEVVKGTHRQVMGKEAEVGAVHAGLECGIIGEKCPGMDMISFGPQIEFPHSPDERVKIDSVGRFYNLLTVTLRTLAQGGT